MIAAQRLARAINLPRTVWGGIVANAYGQLVTLLVAVISVPILLSIWTLEEYGRWLVLLAIPSYLASCDFGIGAAAVNRLVKGQRTMSAEERNTVFHSALAAVGCISAALLVLGAIVPYAFAKFDFVSGLGGTIFGLSIVAAGTIFCTLIDGALRANGKYVAAIYLLNSIRLIECIAGLLAAYVFHTFVATAAAMAAARLGLTAISIVTCARCFSSPTWSLRGFSRKEAREVAISALPFATYPMSNALIFQGLSFVIGATLGPASLVIFNCYRTVTRLVTQLLGAVNRSFWPELSVAFASRATRHFAELFRKCQAVNVILAVAAFAAAVLLGEPVIHLWTHGKVPFDPIYFGTLALGALATGFWQARWVALMATDMHGQFSLIYFALAVFLVGVAFAVLQVWSGVAIAVILLFHEVSLLTAAKIQFQRSFGNLLNEAGDAR